VPSVERNVEAVGLVGELVGILRLGLGVARMPELFILLDVYLGAAFPPCAKRPKRRNSFDDERVIGRAAKSGETLVKLAERRAEPARGTATTDLIIRSDESALSLAHFSIGRISVEITSSLNGRLEETRHSLAKSSNQPLARARVLYLRHSTQADDTRMNAPLVNSTCGLDQQPEKDRSAIVDVALSRGDETPTKRRYARTRRAECATREEETRRSVAFRATRERERERGREREGGRDVGSRNKR